MFVGGGRCCSDNGCLECRQSKKSLSPTFVVALTVAATAVVVQRVIMMTLDVDGCGGGGGYWW